MGNSKIVYYGETLIDLTGDTVEAAKLLKGVTAHDKKGEKITGTLSDVTQATPAITVDAAGKITASATQAAGVVAAGTKSATKQLPVQAAKTVTPSASAQTAVAKGVFTTGIITVAAVYAVIGVTYPSGSTVTCTNGSKTLKAKDTTGKAMFIIPTKGTWTVKAVKGSQSKSVAVKITTEGQVATVELAYDYIIFSNETGLNSVYSDGGGGASVRVGTDSSGKKILTFPTGGGQYGAMAYIKPSIDLTKYATLKISGYAGANRRFCVWNQTPNSYNTGIVASATMSAGSSPRSYTIDVSNLSGNCYLGTEYGVSSTTIYDLRLE